MATILSDYALAGKGFATPDAAGDVVTNRFEFVLTSAALGAGDIIDLGILPANCSIVDALIDTDDLDTNGTPLISLDVGIMSGAVGDSGVRTCGNELFAVDTTARAGGVSRLTKNAALRIAKAEPDRSIGVKIVAAAATQAAAGAKFVLQVSIVG